MPKGSSEVRSISKKIRFEVFKRDGFKCAYCGQSPPQVILEIDHVEAVSKGGNSDINNLITSCFDCNRGKSNIPLEKIPPQLSDNLEVLREKETQLKEYRKFIKKIQERENKDVEYISKIYAGFYGWQWTENFKSVSLKRFLSDLPLHEVENALQITMAKFLSKEDTEEFVNKATNYFCGICWNKIRSRTDPHYEDKKKLIGIWNSRPHGSGYLKQGILDYWLTKYSFDDIANSIVESKGYFSILRQKLGD